MILTMTKMFDMKDGRYSILAWEGHSWWVMERSWDFNKPNVSCVPRDEYTLESHSSQKYPNTWAIVGDGVSHLPTEGIPRFACVLHTAVYPMDLQGCLAPARAITSSGHTIDSRVAMDEIRELLNSATGPIKVMMQ